MHWAAMPEATIYHHYDLGFGEDKIAPTARARQGEVDAISKPQAMNCRAKFELATCIPLLRRPHAPESGGRRRARSGHQTSMFRYFCSYSWTSRWTAMS